MTKKSNKVPLLWITIAFIAGFALAYTLHTFNLWPMNHTASTIAPPVDSSSLGMCPPNVNPPSDPRMGIRVDNPTAAGLNTAFLEQFPTNPIKGGSIGKCMVYAILRSIPATQSYMPYSFGFEDGKVVLILHGGELSPDGSTTVESGSGATAVDPLSDPARLIYKTGTDNDCFCPTMCRDR